MHACRKEQGRAELAVDNRVRIATACVMAAAVAIIASVQSPAAPQKSAQPIPPPKEFAQYCAACHGPTGEGASGPKIIGPTWRHGGDVQSMVASIQRGFPQSGMPPFGDILNDPQVRSIVAFLRSKVSPNAALSALAPGMGDVANIPRGVVQSAVESFRVESVAMFDQPYGVAFLPDGRILVTEAAAGRLRIIEEGKLLPDPVIGTPLGLPPRDWFKRRMLDVAVHPTNGWIYLTSSEGSEVTEGQPETLASYASRGRITLTRGHIRDGRWVDSQTLMQLPSPEGSGARIAFDQKGLVYFGTVGGASSQDLTTSDGKILRLTDDGKIPPDNPFVGQKIEGKDANPYVWAYGFRSPLGLGFDSKGRLWQADEGPRGGDELNLIQRGRNYGWPVITWGHPYDAKPTASHVDDPEMEQPVVNWSPAPALSNVAYYTGSAFPRWKDSLFVGTLKQKTLLRITFDGDRQNLQEMVISDLDRIRDVEIGPDGYVYLLNDGGSLLRLVPAAKS